MVEKRYRIQEVSESGGGGESRRCEFPGCGDSTRLGKGYCTEHVSQQPYVRSLLARLEHRAAEVRSVRRRGARAVDVHGEVAQELIAALDASGRQSLGRLSRELGLSAQVLQSYVHALRDAGFLRIVQGRRESWIQATP